MLPEAVCGMLNMGTGHQLDPTCVFGAGGLEIALQKGVQTRPFFEWCGILLFCIGCCSVCVDTALARPVERFQQDCLSVARNRVRQFDCRREPPSCLYWDLQRGVFFQRCPNHASLCVLGRAHNKTVLNVAGSRVWHVEFGHGTPT